jgi:Actinobacteria/chloroflexi VLRF1 release factor
VKNPAGSGGRWVEISPERLRGWVESFTERHGHPVLVSAAADEATITFTAADGATAECHPPFPPMTEFPPVAKFSPMTELPSVAEFPPMAPGTSPDPADAAADPADAAAAIAAHAAAAIAAHAMAERTVGVFLVRLGGYAAGVFTGSPPRLAASKTGSRLVHGRSAAGGWSQHRFARRREKQASEALQAAASAALTVFGGWGVSGRQLDAVVLGGDKRAVAELREDPRLAPYLQLAADRFLTVPDPRLAVLKDAPRLFLAVKIRLVCANR